MPLNLPDTATIVPVDDNIFARAFDQTGVYKKDSKLVIPDAAIKEIFFAEVVAVGPGRTIEVEAGTGDRIRMKPEYVPGDRIVFSRFRGEKMHLGDKVYILLRHDDVLAKVSVPQDEASVFLKPATLGSGVDDHLTAAQIGA